jgi:O-antigen biosynthesis protein
MSEPHDTWGETAEERAGDRSWESAYWQSHPLTSLHIRSRVSGTPAKDWREVLRTFLPGPVPEILVLGCGGGEDALVYLERGMAEKVLGVDVSPRAIGVASRAAQELGLADRATFRVLELETAKIEGTFSLIVAGQCLHHVRNLESLFDRIRSALAPDGLFALNEYVGPSRFQWSDRVERYMNRLLEALPDRYRREGPGGPLRGPVRRPAPETVAASDDSEAVRSAEILPLLEAQFEVLLRRDYGGTLLQSVLAGIAANFDPDKDVDRSMIELLVAFEEEMIDARVIPSDFTFVVARPRLVPER